mgnify:CR=1 FL=1
MPEQSADSEVLVEGVGVVGEAAIGVVTVGTGAARTVGVVLVGDPLAEAVMVGEADPAAVVVVGVGAFVVHPVTVRIPASSSAGTRLRSGRLARRRVRGAPESSTCGLSHVTVHALPEQSSIGRATRPDSETRARYPLLPAPDPPRLLTHDELTGNEGSPSRGWPERRALRARRNRTRYSEAWSQFWSHLGAFSGVRAGAAILRIA